VKNRTIIISIIVIAVLVAALLSPALQERSAGDNSITPAGKAEKLVIAAYRGDFSSSILIAEHLGYFRRNGLDVQLLEYDSGVKTVQDVIDGKADIATSGEFVAVNNIFMHEDLSILATIALGDAIKLVARRDRGIVEPSDLSGKRVGLKMKSQAEHVLYTYLLEHNISLNDVETVDINPDQMQEAILAGDLDAVVVWNPYAYRIDKVLDNNAVSWNVQHYPFFFLTVSRYELLRSRPQVVSRFLRSLNDADNYIRDHNDEARKIVRDHLGYDEAYSINSWSSLNFEFGLSQTLLLAMESEARWLLKNRFSSRNSIPDFTGNFAMSQLDEVNPSANEVIH
jgi:NitT/TauT family transport system substrate-binding protein